MKIQESRRADNSVRLLCIGTGRHGGRPSQEQYRTTRRSSLPRATSKSNAPFIDQCRPR